jgi:hypothetical protein
MRTLWWDNNDAARYALIKGISPSLAMRILVRSFYHFEETLGLLGISKYEVIEHPKELVGKLLAQ